MKHLLILSLFLFSLTGFAQRALPVSGTVSVGRSSEDASGTIPTLARQQEQTYRMVLTAASPSFTFDMQGYNAFYVQLNNFGAGPANKGQVLVSNDNRVFLPVQVEFIAVNGLPAPIAVIKTLPLTFGIPNQGGLLIGASKTARFVRVTLSTSSGSVYNTAVTVTMTPNQFVPRSADLLTNRDATWRYIAPAGGITTTTPVVFKTASSTAYTQGVKTIRIINAGSGGAEYTIQGTPSGTVLHRGYILPNSDTTESLEEVPFSAYADGLQFVLTSATNMIVYPTIKGISSL
ncbi:MAG: hypothetical protein EOO39_01415 [Cytophagaceae bacterium]|nr:MAG: hypothetical protein EOO39_01415 [Cytophagaceae bacterium]